MLISPPFLPARGATQDDAAYLNTAMHIADHGYFPVSNKLAWHGGVHLQAPPSGNGREPVRAIADGTVAYVRLPTTRPADAAQAEAHVLGYNGWTDDGCVVIRHDTTIGAQGDTETQVRFYSIYMHLREIRNANVVQGQRIYRKTALGTAGTFEGTPNLIHFEIICDDDNLQRLVGRNAGDLNTGADGRTDAVFGELYFKLPANTQVYPQRPALNQVTGAQGTALGEELFVGIHYGGGNAQVTTYRANGTTLGAALTEADAEYNLYRDAGRIVEAYRTARAPQTPAHSAVYELLRFGRILGPDALNPADTPHWRQIRTPSGQGWVNLNATGVTKYSAADAPQWAGWQLVQDYQDNDSRCDVSVIRQRLDENGDGISTSAEAERRLADEAVRKNLSGMVCKFPTEWQRNGIDARWHWLTTEGPNSGSRNAPGMTGNTYLSQADFPEFQRHAEALAFWEDAALEGIQPAHWHFHPVKFVEHFRKCGWLSNDELGRVLSVAPAQGLTRANAIRIPSNKILRKYLINGLPLRIAHFLAQVGHETGWWLYRRENGNERYFRTMYEIITTQEAAEDYRSGLAQRLGLIQRGETEQQYAARRPGAVLAKAATLDNGEANASAGGQRGDGSRFRGRGFLQITGRRNYTSYGTYRGQNFTTDPNPDLLASNDYNACDASGFYWSRESVNREASAGPDRPSVTRVGGIVNRGRADRVPLHNDERWTTFTSIWRGINDIP